jgi:dethiobiotin synthetase
MLDLIRQLDVPVVIAARTTLGTINHTLLTIAAIRNANVQLAGVVMIGNENPENCRAVERYGCVPVIGKIPWLVTINRHTLHSVFRQHFDARPFV